MTVCRTRSSRRGLEVVSLVVNEAEEAGLGGWLRVTKETLDGGLWCQGEDGGPNGGTWDGGLAIFKDNAGQIGLGGGLIEGDLSTATPASLTRDLPGHEPHKASPPHRGPAALLHWPLASAEMCLRVNLAPEALPQLSSCKRSSDE